MATWQMPSAIVERILATTSTKRQTCREAGAQSLRASHKKKKKRGGGRAAERRVVDGIHLNSAPQEFKASVDINKGAPGCR
jgi:hypothetical protein